MLTNLPLCSLLSLLLSCKWNVRNQRLCSFALCATGEQTKTATLQISFVSTSFHFIKYSSTSFHTRGYLSHFYCPVVTFQISFCYKVIYLRKYWFLCCWCFFVFSVCQKRIEQGLPTSVLGYSFSQQRSQLDLVRVFRFSLLCYIFWATCVIHEQHQLIIPHFYEHLLWANVFARTVNETIVYLQNQL